MSVTMYESVGPTPIVQPITVVQGATFSGYFPWLENEVAQDLEGFTAKFAIAKRRGRAAVPVVEVSSVGDDQIVLQPPDDNDVPQAGVVWVRLHPATTELVTFRTPGVYDLWLVDNDDPTEVIRLYEGSVTVDLQASEAE